MWQLVCYRDTVQDKINVELVTGDLVVVLHGSLLVGNISSLTLCEWLLSLLSFQDSSVLWLQLVLSWVIWA